MMLNLVRNYQPDSRIDWASDLSGGSKPTFLYPKVTILCGCRKRDLPPAFLRAGFSPVEPVKIVFKD
jgi:hypothetical protein